MESDAASDYRPILKNDPPTLLDRVNTPWDRVPDFEDYNRKAYDRICRALNDLVRSGTGETHANSQGILILGEAGTGKTHLLMRVARNLAKTNHILFIRKPNNEEAVAQHIWANIVNSLAKPLGPLPESQNQLDDLLAHVFSRILIPVLEKDIQQNKNAELKRRWAFHLRKDPHNLTRLLRRGERRQDDLDRFRRWILRFLQSTHPDVDPIIARVLTTYCFVARPDRKRLLLNWLAGQDVDESEAKDLGIPPSWVHLDETSSDVSTSQQREEQALRAIRTIGILSTYYQPLILAFDQLEGLRNRDRLTENWGDVVREIFTMAPNFLVITCIFPSLWSEWFLPKLDQSVSERIAQRSVDLETFQPEHGLKMLATHLEPSFIAHRLPTNIYPFTPEDVKRLCRKATSPRAFLQAVRSEFDAWLDDDSPSPARDDAASTVISQQEIDRLLRETLSNFQDTKRQEFATELLLDQDFFGRLRTLVETFLPASRKGVSLGKATCGHYVMPPNVVIRHPQTDTALCLAVMNAEGKSFAARMRNLNTCLKEREQFRNVVIIRDRRCRPLGKRGQEYRKEAAALGAVFVDAGLDEITLINAVYETLIAVEEHDLTVGNTALTIDHLVKFLQSERLLSRTEFFRHAGRYCPRLAEATGIQLPAPQHKSAADSDSTAPTSPLPGGLPDPAPQTQQPDASQPLEGPADRRPRVDLLVGDDSLDSPHVAVLGELLESGKRLGISLSRPQCMLLLGYMGSGKSYALGVLIESALLSQPRLVEHVSPLSVVAFNYRKNSAARFEYGGFARPNSKEGEVDRLMSVYGAQPCAIPSVKVFGYEQEIRRRASEYEGLTALPIQFRPDELAAEHWQILMNTPNSDAEYVDIIRDIIRKQFYQERLTLENLERAVQDDERMSSTQRRRAMTRLSFARRWISDSRGYEWADILQAGSLNIFDLRMQAADPSEALKLCLIVTDLVRRTKNGVNKVVAFDEAHEYVDCKELVTDLENAITQIRHDGLSFILASQYPDRIPNTLLKYLTTRFIFKLPDAKAISLVRQMDPHLASLSNQKVANLDLETGVCLLQTSDTCTDRLLRTPQALAIRPRCTLHGGATLRQGPVAVTSDPDLAIAGSPEPVA